MHHLMQWFSTFFPRGPLLLLIVLVDRHKHLMKKLILCFTNTAVHNFMNCIIEIVYVYALFGVKLI